ncbi:hypothetical protein SPKIRA_08020 [Sphingomonas paucimobilis]|uniref:hypothetical protein n=2 Tax=Sphingomonas TaxID=13687 RepID=UPI001022A85F|nr:hypothetical protein [Sphingomonas paucimobilis]QBE91457.1 hypothetical protein DRN02_005040 [Sphingomonas paucimobilis]BCI69972.1 hypothetical protein SPKIRA_08020 [Sphingomonas paucimobilis]
MTASGFAMSESAFPGGMQPWSSLVVERDTGLARGPACAWCGQPIGQAHADQYGARCHRLASRQRMRISMIAYLHLKGRHDLTDNETACRCFDYRNALIEDLRSHDMLDRAIFQEEAARHAPSIQSGARHRAQYAHLDADWNGKGWRPSSLAVIRDCVQQTGGIPAGWRAPQMEGPANA